MELNYFNDIENVDPISAIPTTSKALDALSSIQIGYGTKLMRVDQSGLWLGAEKFVDAPFSVDMNGHLIATSVAITGIGKNFVSTLLWTAVDQDTATWGAGTIKTSDGITYNILAGTTGNITVTTYIYLDLAVSTTVLQQSITAADAAGSGKVLIAIVQKGSTGSEAIITVVGGVGTTINGNQIVTGSISADKIVTGALVVGTNVGLGTAQTASQVTTIVGNVVTTGYVNALNVTANSVNASWVYAGNINADNINAGTLNVGRISAGSITGGTGGKIASDTITDVNISSLNAGKIVAGSIVVGGSGKIDAITILTSSYSSDGYLRWLYSGGFRGKIWTDSDGYMGLTNSGGRCYIYNNNAIMLYLEVGNGSNINGGFTIHGGCHVDNDFYMGGSLTHDFSCGNYKITNCNQGDITTINNTTLNGNSIYYWNLYHYSKGFKGDPFPIIASLSDSIPKNQGDWPEIDHSKLHSEIHAQRGEKNKVDLLDVGKLIMVQSEAINQLQARVLSLEKGGGIK